MRHFLVITVFALIFSTQANAGDGSSGCGPGWFVLKRNSLVSSAIRGTTNNFLAPVVTSGMTTGSSGCTKHSIVKTEKKAIHYVVNNFYELESEIAKGNGVYLSGLAETIGCDSKSQEVFNNELKNKFNQMFSGSEKNAESVLLEVYKSILTNKELAYSCSLS